ncbi:uncharacterized protein LOC123541770 [Mercenaria mercenaria]|uniref:uncharacterized protein LOC123541770 n=1 Tax=Mercenaria mercenaria TaxID=6596 RepID=UPI00234E8EE8|nr:uncharacterized protein LOC123541770 [Mercenaria mercenaria]
MTGLKIALLFGCLTLVAGRTTTVQKTSLSLTEDSEDADELDLTDILQTVLGYSDVTSGEQYGDIVQGCSKGKCEFCKKMFKFNVCFVATLEKDAVVLAVTLGKRQIFKTVIKVPNPPKVCKKSIPHVPFITNVCLQVKDVNLKEASGCVYVSFKFKVKQFSAKIACFKIPTSDGVNQITEAEPGQAEEHGTRPENNEETVVTFESMNTTA